MKYSMVNCARRMILSARNLFIVPIEPLDNRYTKQWHTYIPERFKQEFSEYNVIQIEGDSSGYDRPTQGSFFDFAATCKYKASQAVKIAELFQDGVVKENDIFFFTDAWNQTIHTLKYISELNQIPIKVAGIWHAGAYDPTDILGFTINNNGWVSTLEESMYNAYDMNFFGTEQHRQKFLNSRVVDYASSYVCGYPLDYLLNIRDNYLEYMKKEKQVVFPHRLNPDKAPEIFDFISDYVNNELGRSDIKFVKTQDLNLSKEDYYKELNKSMVVFSANKHENLGIGTFEAMMLGAYTIVPDKLSYSEMYPERYKYSLPYDMYNLYHYEHDWKLIADYIVDVIDGYDYDEMIRICDDSEIIFKQFFSCDGMIELIKTL